MKPTVIMPEKRLYAENKPFELDNETLCFVKMDSAHNYHEISQIINENLNDNLTHHSKILAQINTFVVGTAKQSFDKTIKLASEYNYTLGNPVVTVNTLLDSNMEKSVFNYFSVGLAKKETDKTKDVEFIDNLIYIVGAESQKTETSSQQMLGNPQILKNISEAISEAMQTEAINLIHNISTGGIAKALSLIHSKIKAGIEINGTAIPTKKNIEPSDVLFSETPERFILLIKPEKKVEVETIFRKWDLNFASIGKVLIENKLTVTFDEKNVIDLLANEIQEEKPIAVKSKQAGQSKEYQHYSIFDIPEPSNLKEAISEMLRNPTLVSHKHIEEQFDTTVGANNMSTNFPSDCGVINLKNTNKAIAMNTYCNPKYFAANATEGAMIAAAVAIRNIVCCGATPLVLCANISIHEQRVSAKDSQIEETFKGIEKLKEQFNIANASYSVSTHNENFNETQLFVGCLGVINNKNQHLTYSFKNKGDLIYLIGESKDDISSSEYLHWFHKVKSSPLPTFDLHHEFELQKVIKELIELHFIHSAQAVTTGGLFFNLLKSGMVFGHGFDITTDAEVRTDSFLFGEAQGRVIVSVTPHRETEFIDFMVDSDFPFSLLGHVTKGELRIDDMSLGFIEDLKAVYEQVKS